MAKYVKTRVYVRIEAEEVITGDLGNTVRPHNFEYDETFASGDGSSQFDEVHSDTASATTDYDVAGTVTGADGAAITMTKLGLIAAKCKGTASTDVMYVGGDANSVPFCGAAADFVKVGAKGLVLIVSPVAGWTVTGSTGDVVEINHNTGTYDHDVLLVGRS